MCFNRSWKQYGHVLFWSHYTMPSRLMLSYISYLVSKIWCHSLAYWYKKMVTGVFLWYSNGHTATGDDNCTCRCSSLELQKLKWSVYPLVSIFIWRTAKEWNSLSANLFPDSYNFDFSRRDWITNIKVCMVHSRPHRHFPSDGWMEKRKHKCIVLHWT